MAILFIHSSCLASPLLFSRTRLMQIKSECIPSNSSPLTKRRAFCHSRSPHHSHGAVSPLQKFDPGCRLQGCRQGLPVGCQAWSPSTMPWLPMGEATPPSTPPPLAATGGGLPWKSSRAGLPKAAATQASPPRASFPCQGRSSPPLPTPQRANSVSFLDSLWIANMTWNCPVQYAVLYFHKPRIQAATFARSHAPLFSR